MAAATLHEPPLLFLDEPTSAVDPQSRRDFWESLFELVVRGILLRGASIPELQSEMYALTAFFAVMLSAAIMRFRKRLD